MRTCDFIVYFPLEPPVDLDGPDLGLPHPRRLRRPGQAVVGVLRGVEHRSLVVAALKDYPLFYI